MRYAMLCAIFVFAACDAATFFGPHFQVDHWQPMDSVPSWYRVQYESVAECLGVPGDFNRVEWWEASIIQYDGTVRGIWLYRHPHRVTIWTGAKNIVPTIRHESAHELLGGGEHLPDGSMPCEHPRR